MANGGSSKLAQWQAGGGWMGLMAGRRRWASPFVLAAGGRRQRQLAFNIFSRHGGMRQTNKHKRRQTRHGIAPAAAASALNARVRGFLRNAFRGKRRPSSAIW